MRESIESVRQFYIPGGAHPVQIGGDIRRPPVEQDTGVLQLLKGQLCVEAHQQAVHPVVQPGGDRHPRLPGTIPFLEAVKGRGGRYLFLTNNSSQSVDAYVKNRWGTPSPGWWR